MNQYTGDKWLIHGTKHSKDNQLQNLTPPPPPVEYANK